MTFKGLAVAGAIAAASLGTAATASTIQLTGGSPVTAVGSIPGQDFVAQLTAAGVTDLYSGPLDLLRVGPVKLTFSLVAAESGFSNALLFNGGAVISEGVNNSESLADFTTGALNGQTFTTDFTTGNLADALSFQVNGGATYGKGDAQFGVFADASQIGALSTFFIALDDQPTNADDNHDDIIVRVDVSAVPLPAGGALLLTGLAGVAALRRRKKA